MDVCHSLHRMFRRMLHRTFHRIVAKEAAQQWMEKYTELLHRTFGIECSIERFIECSIECSIELFIKCSIECSIELFIECSIGFYHIPPRPTTMKASGMEKCMEVHELSTILHSCRHGCLCILFGCLTGVQGQQFF